MSKFKLFISAILAGMCIGLGGTVFLRIKDTFPGGNVVGAMLFTVGLFTVCTRSYALYTGKICYIFDMKDKLGYLANCAVIWLGNLVGTGILANAEHLTAICGVNGINAAAQGMVQAKMATSGLSLFILGAICNIFIFIAVNGYAKNPHELGKYLALIFGVTCFILCGTEHSIADMYYWWTSGIMIANPAESLTCILYISLGNFAGGVLYPVLEKHI